MCHKMSSPDICSDAAKQKWDKPYEMNLPSLSNQLFKSKGIILSSSVYISLQRGPISSILKAHNIDQINLSEIIEFNDLALGFRFANKHKR